MRTIAMAKSAEGVPVGTNCRQLCWVQATLGVDAGGLGLRDASLVALPAFIASRTASRPLFVAMAQHMESAGLALPDDSE